MRYAVVSRPNIQPYISDKTIGKVEGSVAITYTTIDKEEIRRCSDLYEEDGVYLLMGDYYYLLLLPETHHYFNFGILVNVIPQVKYDLTDNFNLPLNRLKNKMREDLKTVFHRMYDNITDKY